MNRFSLVLVSFLFPVSLMGQVQYSVGNLMRYGKGQQLSAGLFDRKEYFENQTDVRLFWSDFTMGIQYLYDKPPEFGPDTVGLRQRYVEFGRDAIELRAGHFYTLFGKGLSMNLFENRGINYNTALDGLRGTLRHDYVSAIMAVGTMNFHDLINPNRIERYSVKSGFVELKPYAGVRIGASITSASGSLPSVFGIDEVQAEIPEASLSLSGMGVDFYASYAHKRSTVNRPKGGSRVDHFTRSGDGIYGSLSYVSDAGYGITLEYKDYRFDPVDPFERTDVNRPTRVLPMQNPPTVFKEHLFFLLSRNNHIIDFNDEIGFQLDAYISVTPSITVNLNASAASRQKSYRFNANGSTTVIERSSAQLPSMDAIFSPFYEFYAELEWFLDGHSYLRAAFNRRYDAPYEEFGNLAHVVSSTTIPIRVEYGVSDLYSIGVSLEQQFYHDSFITKNPSYYNEYIAVTLSRASQWSVTGRVELTTDDYDPSGKKFWGVGEISYRLANSHLATLSAGTERGGLVCSNGICRVLNPFDGVRFSLLSQL